MRFPSLKTTRWWWWWCCLACSGRETTSSHSLVWLLCSFYASWYLDKLTLLRLFPFFSVSVLDIFSGISNKTTRVHTHWSKPFIEPEDEEESLREKNRRIYMYMYVCLFVCIENRERYAWMVVSPRMLEGKRMCLRSVPVPNKIRNQSDSESTKKSRQTERERSQVDKISVEKRNTHYEMKAERGKDRIFGDMRMWRERDEGQISVRKISVGIFS